MLVDRVTIRLAKESEALEILSHPAIVERTQLKPEYMRVQPWMAEYDGCRMMFTFWQSGDSFEVHVGSIPDDVRESRRLARSILNWLFGLGAQVLTTQAPPGKISNFIRKLGFVETDQTEDLIFFEVKPWL